MNVVPSVPEVVGEVVDFSLESLHESVVQVNLFSIVHLTKDLDSGVVDVVGVDASAKQLREVFSSIEVFLSVLVLVVGLKDLVFLPFQLGRV